MLKVWVGKATAKLMGAGSESLVKLLTVHPLLLVGVGKATAKLMGAGSGVKLPTVHPVLKGGPATVEGTVIMPYRDPHLPHHHWLLHPHLLLLVLLLL